MEDHVGYSLGEDGIKKEDVNIEMDLARSISPRLKCHVCHKIMGHRSSLYKHLKYVHKIKPAHRVTITCNEKGCCESFTFIEPFRRHLAEQHGFDIVVEKYVFQSMPEFYNWKKLTEQEEHLRFIVSTGPRNSRNGKIHYYRCQKNGVYRPEIKKRHRTVGRTSFVSSTHCISSMFVFEEPECVTVEFCRTHYGHELNTMPLGKDRRKKKEKEKEKEKETGICNFSSTNTVSESSLNFESVDSYEKLKSFLSEKDKTALVTIVKENQHLLQETEELFYENDQDVILKIPFDILRNLIKECDDRDSKSDDDYGLNEESLLTGTEGETSCDEAVIEKLEEDEDLESENSAILKSLGNGVFLDPTSNKRLKVDSLKKKRDILKKKECVAKEKKVDTVDSNKREEIKDWESNRMLVREYLNEFDEKVYVLEPVKDQETVVQKRQKILSQLQTILMMVNSEDNADILDEIRNHLSKYAVPE